MNLTHLFRAFEAAKNAYNIYKKGVSSRDIEGDNNIYGQALQEFQLGYLYERYTMTLIDPTTLKYLAGCNENYPRSFKIKEKVEGIEKALEMYKHAHANFKKINHLYGLYLSKKKEAHLLETYRSYLP